MKIIVVFVALSLLVTVVAIIASISITAGGAAVIDSVEVADPARTDATEAQLKIMKSQIEAYEQRIGQLPDSVEELIDGPSDPELQARWVKPFINEVPEDAWENPVDYRRQGDQYEVVSSGIDGRWGTDDDIIVTGD